MTERTAAQPLPCGTWPSPITAADVAGHYRTVSFPVTRDGEVWWQETLPGDDMHVFHNRQPVFLDRAGAVTWLDLTADHSVLLQGPPPGTLVADPPEPAP